MDWYRHFSLETMFLEVAKSLFFNPNHYVIFSKWFTMWVLIINSILIIQMTNSLNFSMSCLLRLMVGQSMKNKVYFILHLMKLKYMPLPAQNFLKVNWDTCLVLQACFWDLEGPRVFGQVCVNLFLFYKKDLSTRYIDCIGHFLGNISDITPTRPKDTRTLQISKARR